jgi:hypothetical protein
MEGNGSELVLLKKNPREEMLPRVLLHMIEPPLPIDAPFDFHSRMKLPLHKMAHALFTLGYSDDGISAQRPAVVRLPARIRIEVRLVQIDGKKTIAHGLSLRDARRKADPVRVAQVTVRIKIHDDTPGGHPVSGRQR